MAQDDRESLERVLHRTRRVAALLGGTCVALAVALGAAVSVIWPAWRAGGGVDVQQALADREMRRQIVDELVSRGQGRADSHNDGDVGRVLQPNLRDRRAFDYLISSNNQGMREKDIDLPKPAGRTRVVLLGDSLVFGLGIQAEDRVGVLLERHLRERTGVADADIEVLHIGIGSWNILAESAYLRRQMGLMLPDLVIHLTTSNDLDDLEGVRGFGTMSSFSPQRRERADGRVFGHFPAWGLGGTSNHLLTGVDWEGRDRYRRSLEAIHRLKAATERAGAPYLMWCHWATVHPFVREHMTDGLEPDEILYVSQAFALDEGYWVGEGDPHWNPKGMVRMAKLLYGAIQERDLLPQLALEPWEEASRVFHEEHDTEVAAAAKDPPYAGWLRTYPVSADFEVARLSPEIASQVNGGMDPEGRISPYASFHLTSRPGDSVLIRGRGLERAEIDGVEVRVFADEHELGTFTVGHDEVFEHRWPLPAALDEQENISIRLVSNDYCYVGDDLQHCVVFRLERIATVP